MKTLFLSILLSFSLFTFLTDGLAQKGYHRKGPGYPMVKSRRFYDHRGGFKRTTVKLTLSSLINTGRASIEHSYSQKVAFGFNSAYQFAGKQAGTLRFETYFRWYFSHRSPIGMYLFAGPGYAKIRNHTVQKRYTDTESGKDLDFDSNPIFVIERNVSYSSFTGAIGLGFQNSLDIRKRFVMDYSIGYQMLTVPNDLKFSEIENGIIYGKFDSNRGIFGPTSALQARLSLGYLF